MNNRAPHNRTLTLTEAERSALAPRLQTLHEAVQLDDILNKIIWQDALEALEYLPESWVDLLIVDPPYNLTKDFNGTTFHRRDSQAYIDWIEGWVGPVKRLLKPTASVYFCSDWLTSTLLYPVLAQNFIIKNRITWEREKGRGAQHNWKNTSEDIWFCTVSKDYFFDVEAVKIKRQVMAPYRTQDGQPKDWKDDPNNANKYRLTHPSNLWTDITVPFWSMPENTDHPTQKPEKLIAKLILASSKPGEVVFDPFLGSGTTAVVAKKLGRRYVGIEQDLKYCCLAEKRLALADLNPSIQGYANGVFWERNARIRPS